MYIINVYKSCKKDHLSPCLYSQQHAVSIWQHVLYINIHIFLNRKIKCCSHISPDLTLDVTIDINYHRHGDADESDDCNRKRVSYFSIVRNVKRDIRLTCNS